MKNPGWRLIAGGLLVVIGFLALLDSLTIIPFTGIIWGLMFAAGGAAFLVYLAGNRAAWWAVIPGMVLLSLGALILMDTFFPTWGDKAGGFIFLGGTGLAFWLVYLMNRDYWWAIIPGV